MKKQKIISLKKFYTEWEKHAQKFIAPKTSIKSRFDLFNGQEFRKLMASSPVITFVINHATSKYEFFSENSHHITGYTHDDFMNGGVAFGMSITDEDQMHHVGEFLIPKVFEYSERFAKTNGLDKIKFSYNYKIKRKDGSKIWTLHIMTILETDENGNPLVSLVHLVDINHIKKDEKVDICISKKNQNGLYEIVYMASYSKEGKIENDLSDREIEILLHISKGDSSKTIADQLKISIHTVNNHRKRMLKKTGCKNSSELINYGRCKGIAMPLV